MSLEDYNYYGDRRVRARERREPVFEVVMDDDVVELPTMWVVCGTCDGEGKHVNPSIDSGGITGDEMAELGPEFEEEYKRGVYDVPCYECKGRTTVRAVDVSRLSPEVEAAWEEQCAEEAWDEAERLAELRMGC